jgi:protein involved in polysaccharide export with SLBB domain
MTMKAAKPAIEQHLRVEAGLAAPKVAVSLPVPKGKKPLSGAHLVRPDGTVSLADYGNVYVNGMTPDEVKAVMEDHLSNFIDQPEVKVAVVGAAGR